MFVATASRLAVVWIPASSASSPTFDSGNASNIARDAEARGLLAQAHCDLPSTHGLATVKASPWHADMQGLAAVRNSLRN
jgi:hypothetical protein